MLVEIEALELNAAVEQARAAVGTAEANLKVAESNLESARASYATQEANVVRARAVADNDTRNADWRRDRRPERFPRTIAPIDDDAPSRREAHAQ